jgi:hypothetical protein
MKVLLFLSLAIVCMARPDGEEGLKYFDESQLSDGFRRYEATGCPDEVNTCLREMHESVKGCVNQWKQQAGPRYEHCVKNDPVVVNASRDWQVPSLKWHKAMDKCLQGNEAPSQDQLQSLAIENAAMAYYSRRKRDAPTSDAVATCWRTSRQKRDQCKQKAMQCTQFAHCYGEGPEPTSASAKRWYNLVKRLRDETKQKSKIHIMHMGHCLRNEPHTDHDHGGSQHGMHGGHHGAWD